MVNSVEYDHESLKLILPTGTAMVQELSYDHEKESKTETNQKGVPDGLVRGDFKGSVKIVMKRRHFERFINQPSAKYGGVYNTPPLTVIANYGTMGQTPITDEMEFKISKVSGLGTKKGEAQKTTIEGSMTAIPKLNGIPVYTPDI